MIQQILLLLAVMIVFLFTNGCSSGDSGETDEEDEYYSEDGESEDGENGDGESGDGESGDGKNGEAKSEDEDVMFTERKDTDTYHEICDTFSTGLERIATRVMILEDRSLSMNNKKKWPLAKEAIKSMVNTFNNKIAFGLDLFSINGGGLVSMSTVNMCSVGKNVLRDAALNNADNILKTLNRFSPGDATPLLLAMKNFTKSEYAPIFMDGLADSYLVIISDGMDTCGAMGVFNEKKGASVKQLSQITENLKNDSDVKTIVIGFGEGADPDQLNAIAEAGGTSFDTYFDANDGDELAAALKTIAQAVVVSCEYRLGDLDKSELNLDFVNIHFDGKPVPRDDDCAKGIGWSWTDKSQSAIQFCKKACKKLKSESVDEIRMEIACTEKEVNVV